jgi:decaprenylphospho-beta-D-ribofuranose 2-oxidase
VRIHTRPFFSVDQVFGCFAADESDFQVGWMDLTGRTLRGVYHCAVPVARQSLRVHAPVEWDFPAIKLFNRPLVRLLNAVRFRQQRSTDGHVTHVANFHFQVDLLKHWNRFYGRRGFQEYQFSMPAQAGRTLVAEFLLSCRQAGLAPFFAVLKRFGAQPRAGLLSFPHEGYTLMADFEQRPDNQSFFRAFTERVIEAGGRIYLAKDSYLEADQLPRAYPQLEAWRAIVRRHDPRARIQSDLARRLKMKPW